MKYFFDTEFIENGATIDLLSFGMIAEDGREFYQCNRDAKLNLANEWVIWNVYPYLNLSHTSQGWYWNENEKRDSSTLRWNSDAIVVSRYEIRDRVRKFIGEDKPQFWAYYADYDWVALCQLFGAMIDLPKGWPMYCMDLKQLCVSLGDPKLPKTNNEHHALNDAKWVKEQYEMLMRMQHERA